MERLSMRCAHPVGSGPRRKALRVQLPPSPLDALVAQRFSAAGSYPEGPRFESWRGHVVDTAGGAEPDS